MYQQKEKASEGSREDREVAPHFGPAKRGDRFLQPGVIVATLFVLARVLLLLFGLFSTHRKVPLRRSFGKGFLKSGSSGQNSFGRKAVDPSEFELKTSTLARSGRIYLVQIGEKKRPYNLEALAAWLRSSYSLEVQVLPSLALEKSAYDPSRRQYGSQLLNDQIRLRLAALNADPSATILGVTDADMYSIAKDWKSSFTQRDAAHRVAVVSADCFDEDTVTELTAKPGAYAAALENALQRILLRDIAILCWHMPLNNDPESLLAPTLDVTLPGHALYESELHPERTPSGMYISEPCLSFSYKRAKQKGPARLEPAVDFIVECDELAERSHDEQQERFQVNLEYGLLTVRHSDFYQPGVIPLEFERATSSWLKSSSLAFGRSGSHNYDRYLGTWDDMRHISVVSAGRDSQPLVRIPERIPMLLFNRWVDQDGSGKMTELRWHPGPGERFDLTRYTGEVETYLPCDEKTICYLNEIRNGHGDTLRFERDGNRSLTRLTGPDQHWLALSYGDGRRISQITDNRGRQVTYDYDERGYLIGVNYPSGERLEYSYDDDGHLITFSAAADATTRAQLLVRNDYEQGRLSRQTLADGRVFEYRYAAKAATEPATGGSITRPDGTVLDFANSSEHGSTVRERLKR